MLTRSPLATIYRHLATYFSFPSTILGNKASGWLGCAAHGMRIIIREPMRPSEELENESEMTLELFGFVKQSAVTSHSPTHTHTHTHMAGWQDDILDQPSTTVCSLRVLGLLREFMLLDAFKLH